MGYRKISRDVKLCAVKLYEMGHMSLQDILECVGFAERTWWRIWKLYTTTGDVEPPTRGRPRILHFNDVTYLLSLV